jgi:hypothetical protein
VLEGNIANLNSAQNRQSDAASIERENVGVPVKSNLRHRDPLLRLIEILQLSLTKPSNEFNQGGCDEEINVVYGSGIFGAARCGPRSIA